MNKEVEIDDLLGYDGLKIIQRKDMFKFSLDSTILGYYVTINKCIKKVVDLGCGNGFIPFFLSLRTKAKITGIEIQEEVAELAKQGVALNHLEDQVEIINIDMKEAHNLVGISQADVVTCNPPFFKYNEKSIINESEYQTIARHEVKITLDEAVHEANILLKDGGTFAMVHRADRLIEVINAFTNNGFNISKLLFVYSKTSSKEAQVIFVEGKKTKGQGGIKILPPLYVYHDDGSYTNEILEIFNFKKGEHNAK